MQTKIILLGLILSQAGYAQTFSEKITKELSFEKQSTENALMISNLHGNIKVVGYAGEKILLEATKSIDAKTEARLENGKADVQLGIIDRADTIIVYVRDSCHQFRKNKGGSNRSGWQPEGWGYQSIQNDCDPGYDYKMDFILKVPARLNLVVNTINNGDVVVENVNGIVKANNINGSIRLANLTTQSEARTINGDVDIDFSTNPAKDCSFYSLNGDINASFQPGLSANMSFESFNGSFYTNIQNMETLPLKVQKASHGEGVKYKINGSRYQIGNGGAFLDFETFNGNVYLKEKTK